MLKQNTLQFAVVREDPEVELELFRKYEFKNAILIGSGGCTAISLASEFPEVKLTIIEPNPAQLKLIGEKIRALKKWKGAVLNRKFGVGISDEHGMSLIERGNFESLFRGLRSFIFNFIADKKQFAALLKRGSKTKWQSVFKHPYWSVAFDLYFSNSILETMFGAAAIQHAPKNSYPIHFRSVIEKGLLRSDRKDNYFLYHILLGHYPSHKSGWPPYLRKQDKIISLSTFQGLAQNFKNYSGFDFVDLSNIFDWSSEGEVKRLAKKLTKELEPGAFILYRQLNNSKNFRPHFGSSFDWLDTEADRLHQKDRSLFYSSIHIARKAK